MSLFRTKAIIDCNADTGLKRALTAFDLTLLGIGAIIGAGIFVLTGIAAATKAGPAIVLSYCVAGGVCALAALSYAELAAAVGGAGSAYGYAYAGLGEIIAETAAAAASERQGRLIDSDQPASMEKKKREGYF